MSNNYFRITAYYPAEDISCIIDTYGKYDEIWQFSAYLVKLKFKIIDVAGEGQFDLGNIQPIKEKKRPVYLTRLHEMQGGKTGRRYYHQR
jgi:hypothetical protein